MSRGAGRREGGKEAQRRCGHAAVRLLLLLPEEGQTGEAGRRLACCQRAAPHLWRRLEQRRCPRRCSRAACRHGQPALSEIRLARPSGASQRVSRPSIPAPCLPWVPGLARPRTALRVRDGWTLDPSEAIKGLCRLLRRRHPAVPAPVRLWRGGHSAGSAGAAWSKPASEAREARLRTSELEWRHAWKRQ